MEREPYQHPLDTPEDQPALDWHTWTKPTLERPDAGQLNRWDDMGNYYEEEKGTHVETKTEAND